MSKINIDASLQTYLDPLLTIARGTFAKDSNDETVKNSALLTFAGMGLVKLVPRKNGPTWFPTDLLVEQSKNPSRPFDLAPFMDASAEEYKEPQVTGSLRLMIQDIVETKRQQRLEATERDGFDAILLLLAGLGLASLNDVLGEEPIWVAEPDLFDKYESVRDALSGGVVRKRKSEIRLDDLLKNVTEEFHKMVKATLGINAKRRTVTLAFLLAHELAGDVVAYKDDEGRFAWKGSDQLRRWFEEN